MNRKFWFIVINTVNTYRSRSIYSNIYSFHIFSKWLKWVIPLNMKLAILSVIWTMICESFWLGYSNQEIPFMDHSLVIAKGLCIIQWSYEPCCEGPQMTDGSWWRILTKCGPLEEWKANYASILAVRTHEHEHVQYEKAKRYDTGRWTSQVGKCPICYCGRVEGNY